MGVGDIILLVLTLACLGVAGYLFYSQMAIDNVQYKAFVSNVTMDLPNSSVQFYPNMRFQSKEISYEIDESCGDDMRPDIEEAFRILDAKTIMSFVEKTGLVDILVKCDTSAPELAEKNHVIAGAAKPNNIVNATKFFVIENSSVTMYKEESCNVPLVSIHELLHAIGFDHNNDEKSIMYPLVNCDQEIDSEIINEINRIYSFESLPDLVISKLVSNSSGRYINFEIEVANQGLKDSVKNTLEIVSEGEVDKSYDLGVIEIGKKKILLVQNLKVEDNKNVEFRVIPEGKDLNTKDNIAKLVVA